MTRKAAKVIPVWARDESPDTLALLESEGHLASNEPERIPTLPARLLPSGGGSTLSSKTIVDTINTTQRLATYAAYESFRGPSLGLSDIRTVDKRIAEVARLEVAPFEEGSFVIPTRLSEATVAVEDDQGRKIERSGHDVVTRFAEVMEGLEEHGPNFPVAIGVLQAIEDFGVVLRRDVKYVEFYAGRPEPFPVTKEYVKHIHAVWEHRQEPRIQSDTLEGTITAVDIDRGTFKLTTAGKVTVNGGFERLMESRLVSLLGSRATVDGVVEYRDNAPRYVRAFYVDPVEPS